MRQACFVLLLMSVVTVGVRAVGSQLLLSLPSIFWPVLAWCWISVMWAIDPASSLRRVAFTSIVLLSIAYSVRLLSYQRVIGVLIACMSCILLLDCVALLLFPLAVHPPSEIDQSLVGNWRGIHNHKNEAGAFCALCVILLGHEALRTRSRLTGTFLVATAAIFLLQSRSKTAEGFICVSLMSGVLAQLAYNNPTFRRVLLLGIAATSLVALPFSDQIGSALSDMFDDPASLTGRVQIWPVLMAFVADHPLLGAGYGSFWAIGDASPILNYADGWITKIDHSHNGYLELLVHTGAIGLAIGIVTLVLLPLRTLFFKPLAADVSRSLIVSMLMFGFMHDLLETSLLNRANPTWVISVIFYCLLGKATGPTLHPAVAHLPPTLFSVRREKIAWRPMAGR